MEKKTKIVNSGNFKSEGPMQIKNTVSGKVQTGGDLRSATTGGAKASK